MQPETPETALAAPARPSWNVVLHAVVILLQLVLGLGMYALNLRFQLIEKEIAAVNQRIEDHLRASGEARQEPAPPLTRAAGILAVTSARKSATVRPIRLSIANPPTP